MKKASVNSDVVVGHMYEFSPEHLRACIAMMEDGKKRASPGEKIWIQPAHGLWFYWDPNLSRSELERSIAVVKPLESRGPNGLTPAPEMEQAEILDMN